MENIKEIESIESITILSKNQINSLEVAINDYQIAEANYKRTSSGNFNVHILSYAALDPIKKKKRLQKLIDTHGKEKISSSLSNLYGDSFEKIKNLFY